MPKLDTAYFAVPADETFPYERVGHFVKSLAPDGAREISKEEADKIDADVAARSPKVAAQAVAPAGQADLSPLLAQIDALKKVVADHAALHDEHEKKIADQAKLIEEKDEEIRKRTAKAIADLTADIGTTGVGG